MSDKKYRKTKGNKKQDIEISKQIILKRETNYIKTKNLEISNESI